MFLTLTRKRRILRYFKRKFWMISAANTSALRSFSVSLNDPCVKLLHAHVHVHVCRHTGLLEVYHNTILAYTPKRLSFRWSTEYFIVNQESPFFSFFWFCSEETAIIKIFLTIMDHNLHINRSCKEGDTEESGQYARRFRRRSTRWDVTCLKEKQEHQYVPALLATIFKYREQLMTSLQSIGRKRRAGSSVITLLSPPNTQDIITSKKCPFVLQSLIILVTMMM